MDQPGWGARSTLFCYHCTAYQHPALTAGHHERAEQVLHRQTCPGETQTRTGLVLVFSSEWMAWRPTTVTTTRMLPLHWISASSVGQLDHHDRALNEQILHWEKQLTQGNYRLLMTGRGVGVLETTREKLHGSLYFYLHLNGFKDREQWHELYCCQASTSNLPTVSPRQAFKRASARSA